MRLGGWASRFYYGWWIVASAILVQCVLVGLVIQAFGTYAVVWNTEFGWSKTAIASAYALMQVGGGVLGPFQGVLLHRLGPRLVIRLGLILLGMSFYLLSLVNSIVDLYLVFLAASIGVSLAGFLSLSTVVVNWFDRRRSSALAIMHIGQGMGGLLVPAVALAISAVGWRLTAVASGTALVLASLTVGRLFVNNPAPSTTPGIAILSNSSSESDSRFGTRSLTRRAFATPAFWTLAASHALSNMAVSAILVHIVIFLHEEFNLSLTHSASALALITAGSVFGQVLGGLMGDRFPKHIVAAGATLLHSVALFLLASTESLPVIVAAVLLHGVAWGVRGPLMLAIRADYFGRASFPTVMGLSSTFAMGGAVVGPLLVGYAADSLGAYSFGFAAISGITVIAAMLMLFSRPPRALKPYSYG